MIITSKDILRLFKQLPEQYSQSQPNINEQINSWSQQNNPQVPIYEQNNFQANPSYTQLGSNKVLIRTITIMS